MLRTIVLDNMCQLTPTGWVGSAREESVLR